MPIVMAGPTYPSLTEIRPCQGLSNPRFPLIRPAKKLVFLVGVVVRAMLFPGI